MMLTSVVGPGTSLKALHAALACKGEVALFPEMPSGCNDYCLLYDSAGYQRHLCKIAPGWFQMMLVSRSVGFMPTLNAAALWGLLTSEAYTTPLLRSWLPWVQQTLLDREMLLPLRCFGCQCGWLKATNDDLDEVVSEGLRTRKLVIA